MVRVFFFFFFKYTYHEHVQGLLVRKSQINLRIIYDNVLRKDFPVSGIESRTESVGGGNVPFSSCAKYS